MSPISRKWLHWTPRALGIAFAVFVSIFALDVFSMDAPLWRQLLGFAIHLIPTYLVVTVLVFAWKREWVGAVGFIALGLLYIGMTWGKFALGVYFIISGPVFLIGLLFLADWLLRRKLRASV